MAAKLPTSMAYAVASPSSSMMTPTSEIWLPVTETSSPSHNSRKSRAVRSGVTSSATRRIPRRKRPWSWAVLTSLRPCRSGVSLGLGHDPDVGLRLLPVAEDLLGLVVRDRPGDDHVVALLPVHRSGHAVLGRELQRVDDPQDLVEVAAGRHRVHEDLLDLLVWSDPEHVAVGLVCGGDPLLGITRRACGQHSVELRDVVVGVAG